MPLREIAEDQSQRLSPGAEHARLLEDIMGGDMRAPVNFHYAIKEVFNRIDKDQSGGLSKFELTDYMTSPMATEQGKAAAKIVAEHFDDFKTLAEPQSKTAKGEDAKARSDFFNDKHTGDEVSRRDLDAFYNTAVFTFPVNHSADNLAFGRSIRGTIFMAEGAVLTGLFGICAFASPEPFTKIACGTGAAVGLSAFEYGRREFSKTTDALTEAVQKRRDMINSWKAFDLR